jgi:hypothetical protein
MSDFSPEKIAAARQLGRYLRSTGDIRDEAVRHEAIHMRVVEHIDHICNQHMTSNGPCFSTEQRECLKAIGLQVTLSLIESQKRRGFVRGAFDEWRAKSPLTKLGAAAAAIAIVIALITGVYESGRWAYQIWTRVSFTSGALNSPTSGPLAK